MANYICILATTENVEAVRVKARELPNFADSPNILTLPVSSDGERPATHWFCTFKVSEGFYEQLMAIRELSEMELAEPRKFLRERNLKLIR
jgi:hypothetical protein